MGEDSTRNERLIYGKTPPSNPSNYIEVVSPTHPESPYDDPLISKGNWNNPVSYGGAFQRKIGDGDVVVGDPTDFKHDDLNDFDKGWDLMGL